MSDSRYSIHVVFIVDIFIYCCECLSGTRALLPLFSLSVIIQSDNYVHYRPEEVVKDFGHRLRIMRTRTPQTSIVLAVTYKIKWSTPICPIKDDEE